MGYVIATWPTLEWEKRKVVFNDNESRYEIDLIAIPERELATPNLYVYPSISYVYRISDGPCIQN